jgi:carbon catabolite-derepressing protein kinase
MSSTAKLADSKGVNPYDRPSPPVWNALEGGIPTGQPGSRPIDKQPFARAPGLQPLKTASPPPKSSHANVKLPPVDNDDLEAPYCPLTDEEKAKLADEAGGSSTDSPAPPTAAKERPYISNVRILRTSIPIVHKAYMSLVEDKGWSWDEAAAFVLDGKEREDPNEEHQPPTAEEQADMARRLKGAGKITPTVMEETSSKPATMTPVPVKKARPTKWQFGIRSRNQPLEAMGCIYRALQKLGAKWLIDDQWHADADECTQEEYDPLPNLQSRHQCTLLTFCSEPEVKYDEDDEDGGPLHHTNSMTKTDRKSRPNSKPTKPRDSSESVISHDKSDDSIRFIGKTPSEVYDLPADPWVLRVKWKLDSLYPPGTVPPSSTHSSTVDLRRPSIASLSSGAGSVPRESEASPRAVSSSAAPPAPTESVVCHMDVQLYEMDQGIYLVDFKCAGYENKDGLLLEEKEVTSPFPFLDLASNLIIQLAEAD